MTRLRAALVWGALCLALGVPIYAAAQSALLQWRDPVYVAAGFAGVVALCLLLVQPLLASGLMPGLEAPRWRRVHRWTGAALAVSVVAHVAGLWVTSPPDMVDALLFVSPTPFSAWGVIAMWAVFATAALAVLRRRRRLRWRTWRRGHLGLAVVIVAGSVVHAALIEGTMETVSKLVLSGLVVLAALRVVLGPRPPVSEAGREAPAKPRR